jgi:hypothetical protein
MTPGGPGKAGPILHTMLKPYPAMQTGGKLLLKEGLKLVVAKFYKYESRY